MCDPWETMEFMNHTEQIPDDYCNECWSDCNSTIYHVTVSSAPFKVCDHTNLQTSKMCKLTSGDQINPPSWTTEVDSQYLGNQKFFINYILFIKYYFFQSFST